MDWFWIIIAIVAILVIWYLWKSNNETSTTSTSKPTATARTQMVEDIKATQTSRISDVAEIMDELSQTSSNYRHYCELIGTSMDKGVVAPYSQREVAYYDIRCYRVDYKGGQEVETLVAHETSINPFCFKDASSDRPVYVNLASFGGNVILVNSTNHIEGPNSEFSKKLGERITSATGSSYSTACTASVPERLGNLLRGAADALDRVLLPGGAPVCGLVAAGAVAGGMGSNVLFAAPASGGHNMGNRSGKVNVNVNVGGRGSMGNMSGRPQMPTGGQMPRGMGMGTGGLDTFLGQGLGGSFSYGGGGRYYGGYGSDLGTTLLNVGLGALLSSMYSSSSSTNQTTTTTPQSTFRGYRLVEDVVPLNSPIYCIGEVYLHGADLYIGKSTDDDYTTSFFACKPESEVVEHLKS